MNDSPPRRADTARASSLTPFKYNIFLALWLASLCSNFGGLIQSVGASWLMTSLSPTADVVALVQASTVLPYMLFCLAAGAAADVFDRRILMLSAQILALVVSILLTVFTFTGIMTPWLLLTFTFLVGCGNAIYGPAWQSSVGEVVPRTELPQAVALNSLGFNLARTVGPAIGGLIVAASGSQAAFLVNSVSYLGLIIVLICWKRPVEQRPLPPESIPSAMMAGLRYVALSPSIQSVLVRAVVFGMAASSIWALMPLVARDLIQGGPTIYGLLLGAFGVGAVLSALSSTRLRAAFTTGQIVTIATLFFATGSIIAAFSTSLPITMIGMVMCGGGWVLALSTFNISVQLSVPRWVVGRSVAIYQTMTFGGMALGSWLWGLTAHHFGLVFSLALAGGVLARLGPAGSDLADAQHRRRESRSAPAGFRHADPRPGDSLSRGPCRPHHRVSRGQGGCAAVRRRDAQAGPGAPAQRRPPLVADGGRDRSGTVGRALPVSDLDRVPAPEAPRHRLRSRGLGPCAHLPPRRRAAEGPPPDCAIGGGHCRHAGRAAGAHADGRDHRSRLAA